MSFEAGPTSTMPAPATFGMTTRSGPDAAQWLPDAVADKLRALRQRASDLRAPCPDSADVLGANTAKMRAEARLKQLTESRSAGGFGLDPTDVREIEAEREIGRATAEADRLAKLKVERRDRMARGVHAAIEHRDMVEW